MNKWILFVGLFYFHALPPAAAQNNNSTKPLVIGEEISHYSQVLGENRSLNIYLPPGYSDSDSIAYPVVYLFDGGIDEDFIHIAGIYQFSSFSWVNRVTPSIIVGIVNTDRMHDMTYPDPILKKQYPTSGGSGKFIEYIQKELQPFIQKKYGTTDDKTLIGESLAGLLATEILLKKPALFDKYIIVSPSLWWDDGSLLNMDSKILDSSFNKKTQVFIAVGKEGLTPGIKPHVQEVDANLLAEKIKSSKSPFVSVYFDYLPGEDHATIMHQAVLDALKVMKK